MNKNKMDNLFAGGRKLALIAMLAAMPLSNVLAQESVDGTDNTIIMSFDQTEKENTEMVLHILGFAIGFGGGYYLLKNINERKINKKLKDFQR